MTESNLQAQILRALTADPTVRLFRNNTGQAWVGELLARHPNGSILLAHARPLHAGLHVGSGDLIGWHRGRFLSVEVKTPDGRPTVEQLTWRDNVLRAGGIAGIVRGVDEALALLRT